MLEAEAHQSIPATPKIDAIQGVDVTGTVPPNPSDIALSSPITPLSQPEKYPLLEQTVAFANTPEPEKDPKKEEKDALVKEAITHYKDALKSQNEGDKETAQKHAESGKKAEERKDNLDKKDKS